MGSFSAILRRGIVLWGCAVAATLSGCGPTRLTVKPQIPPLLMTPLPMAMGVRIPKSFAEYVQKDQAQGREWQISLGAGQADAIRRVTGAMFEHTLVLGDPSAGDAAAIAEHKLNAILETTLDSYVYLLPSPSGADYYSATIGYKVNLLKVDGTVLGSWVYEGYGSAPSRGLSDAKGVNLVTALAIRDACANLAVHLPDQELVRNLLAPAAAPAPSADKAASGAAGTSAEASSSPTEAKPSAEPGPSAATGPAAGTPPGGGTLPPAEEKPGTGATATPEGTPGDASGTPAPTPAPEAKPPSNTVEVQPTTGN